MPTGPEHQRFMHDEATGVETGSEVCRCMRGYDHDDEHFESNEALDEDDAADIWLSKGMDEDYTFGYSESELRRAADQS